MVGRDLDQGGLRAVDRATVNVSLENLSPTWAAFAVNELQLAFAVRTRAVRCWIAFFVFIWLNRHLFALPQEIATLL